MPVETNEFSPFAGSEDIRRLEGPSSSVPALEYVMSIEFVDSELFVVLLAID